MQMNDIKIGNFRKILVQKLLAPMPHSSKVWGSNLILPVLVWTFFKYSGFHPLSKNLHVRLIECTKSVGLELLSYHLNNTQVSYIKNRDIIPKKVHVKSLKRFYIIYNLDINTVLQYL